MRKLRILFVFPSLELGGAERQGLHLARYLREQGCNVRVWGTHAGTGMVVGKCEELGFPWSIYRFLWPCRKSSLLRDGFRIIHALRRERPDGILAYTNSPNVACGLTWRWSPAKFCIWGQRNTNELRGDGVERYAYRRVSAVICNAEHEVEYLKRNLGPTPVPIHVVHNGLELAPTQKTIAEWRTELGIGDNTVVAVMVANFRSEKDHPTLLNAWSRMLRDWPEADPQPCLVLAGAPQFTFGEVQRLAGELGILDTLRFLGQVMDVSGLLAAIDIGILVSHYEGLPNALLEYMAAGIPVIATDLPGNREALGCDAGDIFCQPGDPDDLAMRLERMVRDSALRKQLGDSNLQRAEKYFSVITMCEKTIRIINGLLENGSNKPRR